jgi:hypothetical protein
MGWLGGGNVPAVLRVLSGGLSLSRQLECRSCGQVHPNAKIIKVPDGREMGSYSEEYRRYCEASWVLRKRRNRKTRTAYLDLVGQKRGAMAAYELREEMVRQWHHRQGQE